jgi:hypothetical protein
VTLNDYLNSLSDEQRTAFVKRVEAVGNQTVDVFSEALPKWYDPEACSLDVNSVYAVHKHEGPNGSGHFHLLLLDYQYAYWEDADRKPAKPTKPEDPDPKTEKPENDVRIVASKADKNFFKDTAKSDASIEDGPRHVFGSSLYDPDKRVFIFPGTQKKQPIDVGAKPIEVGKEEPKT